MIVNTTSGLVRVDETEGCAVHSIPGADHGHQRYDAGPAGDQKHGAAVRRSPDKPAAERAPYLDRVTDSDRPAETATPAARAAAP